MRMIRGDGTFEWDALVPLVIHPLKVVIVEALLYIDQPLSATEITKLIDDKKRSSLSHVSYHLVELYKGGVLKLARKRQVRGATEKFYFFR